MSQELKTCQNCSQNFRIEPDDFKFYEKIKVPPPTWCPECRLQRRLVLRNERRLYKRECDLCKQDIISMYPATVVFPVYCYRCWWGDGWDPLQYGHNIDLNRSFFEQYAVLQNAVPRTGLFNINAVNSEYNNYSLDNKDCYFSFRIVESERCYYDYYCLRGKECVNSLYTKRGELLHGCFDTRGCYQSSFLVDCENCMNCAFSYDLKNCTNCLFSHNLRNKQYQVRNKPVSPEEFKRIWSEWVSGSRVKTREAKRIFDTIFSQKAIHRANKIIRSTNAHGANLVNCKDTYELYNGTDSEHVRYGDDVETTRDSMDVKGPMASELAYECCSIDNGCARIYFSNFCQQGCLDTYYSSFCVNSRDLFGCISIKNGRNCILNKQYSEKECGRIKNELIGAMKKRGEFGENFPGSISPFHYNATVAMEYFPLTKDEATSKGYQWEDEHGGTYGQETVAQEDVADEIKNTNDVFANTVLKCEECGKNYRIIQEELQLLRRFPAPVPEKCPECRYHEMLRFRLPRRLWHRVCQCAGIQSDNGVYQNTATHRHGANHCPEEFETSYAPERHEIVYCEQCYQAEVI